jgi:hypothetical protein
MIECWLSKAESNEVAFVALISNHCFALCTLCSFSPG